MSVKQLPWIVAVVLAPLWLTPAGVDAKAAKSTPTAKSDSTTRAPPILPPEGSRQGSTVESVANASIQEKANDP